MASLFALAKSKLIGNRADGLREMSRWAKRGTETGYTRREGRLREVRRRVSTDQVRGVNMSSMRR